MIFSVQNSNLMYSVKVTPDLLQLQVRKTVSEDFFGTSGYTNPNLAHGGSDVKVFQQTSFDASTHHREPIWKIANDGDCV